MVGGRAWSPEDADQGCSRVRIRGSSGGPSGGRRSVAGHAARRLQPAKSGADFSPIGGTLDITHRSHLGRGDTDQRFRTRGSGLEGSAVIGASFVSQSRWHFHLGWRSCQSGFSPGVVATTEELKAEKPPLGENGGP